MAEVVEAKTGMSTKAKVLLGCGGCLILIILVIVIVISLGGNFEFSATTGR